MRQVTAMAPVTLYLDDVDEDLEIRGVGLIGALSFAYRSSDVMMVSFTRNICHFFVVGPPCVVIVAMEMSGRRGLIISSLSSASESRIELGQLSCTCQVKCDIYQATSYQFVRRQWRQHFWTRFDR